MINLLFVLAVLVLLVAPIGIEFLIFKKDKEEKISYKRFKTVVFTLVYFVGVTVALFFLKELILWIESLSFVEWIAKTIAISGETSYLIKVLIAIVANVVIGALFVFLARFTRFGIKKKSFVFPEKKNGRFSLGQRINRRVIKFFYKEIWFFVGKIIKYLSFALSAIYAVIFVLYLIPALSDAWWIPYDFISMLFSAGYIYPMLSLLVLWETYFFLEGIERVEIECPELLEEESSEITQVPIELEEIDEIIRKEIPAFFVCNIDVAKECKAEISSTNHHKLTELIKNAVVHDKRNSQEVKETYLNCIDKLCETDKSAVINGTFFSEFSMYFLRYLSIIIARGDNVVFVCNNDAQIDEVYDYLNEGYSQIYSLFCDGFKLDGVNYDNPIWRIAKVKGDGKSSDNSAVDDSSVLVTNLAYLTSQEFERDNSRFVHLIDTIVFVDTLKTVNTYNRQLAILNTRLTNITKTNALNSRNKNINTNFNVRYMSKPVRYICFDDTRIASIDKVLSNILGLEFESIDSMRYNENTILRCYNYEAFSDDDGKRIVQTVGGIETVGVVMSAAVTCAREVQNVTVFAEETLPYADISETLAANSVCLNGALDKNPILINKKFYNPDDYSVLFVVDEENNLPATLRKYASMTSDKPTLIYVFSRPYMLRDYYIANPDKLWSTQIERIPVEIGGNKRFAQSILARADAGGISEDEICRLALDVKTFKDDAKNHNVNAILRRILEIYGFSKNERNDLYKYFEFTTIHDFDEFGEFVVENKVHMRKRGQLYEMINGRDMITMVIPEKEITLNLPKSRLAQNYIAGQNLLHNGKVYYIKDIDMNRGRIYAEQSLVGNNNDPYEYIQDRKYHVEMASDYIEPLFATKPLPINHTEDGVTVDEIHISAFKAPMEVMTNGYYTIDPHRKAIDIDGYENINTANDGKRAKQAYRRYGKLSMCAYSLEGEVNSLSKENGATMMCVRICGQFGANADKICTLAATMLNEILHSMFPSTKDAVVVCPVVKSNFDEDSKHIVKMQPKIEVDGDGIFWNDGDLTLMIIEDCATDLGVISHLMAIGNGIIDALFDPITEYLRWYLKSDNKSTYLYFSLDHEPSCFDFEALYNVSKLLSEEKSNLKNIDIEAVMEYESCDFCEKRYSKGGRDVNILVDSRKMCNACRSQIVGNNKRALEAHLNGAKIFLESTYGIDVSDYDVIFEPTVKIVNTLNQNRNLIGRGADVPLKSYIDDKKRIHVEHEIPSVNLSELLVRELTHLWQIKNLPNLSDELAEGQIALVTVQYLRFVNNTKLAKARVNYYESTSDVSGEGYRCLVRDLLGKISVRNNPFKYLMEMGGNGSGDAVIPPEPQNIEIGDDEEPYTPESYDRDLVNGSVYFYYPRLSANKKRAYDLMLEAIKKHEGMITIDGCSFEDLVNVRDAILYDHPELFWFNNFVMCGNEVTFKYGVTVDEARDIQNRIDAVVPRYLDGITDSMSAYDVALRIHAKIIAEVDYDTIALDKQKRAGGPKDDEIDYLRSICGVFLNGKAVCEGYARAVQYLLQKCGIECGEAAGYMLSENGSRSGGAHAWNILKMDGDYYYMDVTWDDSSNTVQAVKSNDLGFNYFCVTTDEMSRTRDFSLSPLDMPECTATKCNYYYHNNFVIDSYDINKIKSIAVAAAEKDAKFFTFKCKTSAVYNETLKNLFNECGDCFDVVKAASKVNKIINASTYRYSYDKNICTVRVTFKEK